MEQARLLKVGQAAEILAVTEGSLREGLHSGRIPIPTVRVGVRGVRIAASDLEAYIAGNRKHGECACGAGRR
jgi:excisionase family DNA binding protein